ncbi:hypothetical protein [Rudaeicoccus suwonensis]|uniref:Glyoxalase-like protein n=1 Tax=Rudaeicoccus suwonensis TaxID=657409 RepID=A0A561DX03_9MICO|nr:hypothetical protein [Rudaeicoccus suwonensis]TWE07887.1 hypothetical protein BKA23_3254 [Rudaeicoccus suwonensis]
MTALPALRQLVFLAADLDTTLATARAEFGLREGISDAAGMAQLGFVHQVLTIGRTHLEFTAPLSPDTGPGRLVAHRGDIGYMVVIQVADIDATIRRAAALDLTPVLETPYEDNTITQWHPRDFGTLLELDQIRPADSWHMAPRIFEIGSTDVVGDVTGIDIAVADPPTVAQTWATVLDIQLRNQDTTLDLDGRTIRFVRACRSAETGLVAVELPLTDPSAPARSVTVSGVDFRLVPAAAPTDNSLRLL